MGAENEKRKLVWDREKCLVCAGCVGICPALALDFRELEWTLDDGRCTRCGLCVRFCPAGALDVVRGR